MLDTDTKRRIDTARDILVGKVPDPKSQVEQITIALIYKFMDDMDAESEELGGERSFFTGKFAKYGWAKLMDRSLGGHEMLGLYGEGISKMPENPGIPALFRDIFKNAYLPYRDPETLRAFLKIINEFSYDHSERLGDAFEYLLSVLGSQGDAGQFRTPRHIIDFMVAVLDPKKDEKVLDPACGTAGFLISAYKHILRANDPSDPANQSDPTNLGKPAVQPLTPDDRVRLARNFKGYDISPDMVRLSLVNLYLHGFTEPHIYEYDTLTSEERWNEFADVILANPPFMSPKGGIKPHKRFSIQAKRSEVLFVDYMAEHLTPKGRAAIIVPEGIIFQSQTAYKELRKMLVENSLVAVVSLPAGCFNPYSGVKTSILVLDKSLARKSDTIAFFKVENDGFSLGAQRRAIGRNDLPQVESELAAYLHALCSGKGGTGILPVDSTAQIVPKAKIAANGDYNLSGERYRDTIAALGHYPAKALGELLEIQSGYPFKSELFNEATGFPIIRIRDIKPNRTVTKYTGEYDPAFLVQNGDLLIGMDGEFNSVIWNGGPALLNQRVSKLHSFTGCLKEYVARLIPKKLQEIEDGTYAVTVKHISGKQIAAIEIPLPPLEVQKEIVAEIEGYQRVINGARAVLDHYRPHIPIHPDWPMVELGEICDLYQPKTITGQDLIADGPYLVFGANGIIGRYDQYNHEEAEVLITCRGATCGTINKSEPKSWVTGNAMVARPKDERLSKDFLFSLLKGSDLGPTISGSAQPQITRQGLAPFAIPLPPLATQRAIVAEIEAEQALVAANRELITRFERKIQATLARIWGEEAEPTAMDCGSPLPLSLPQPAAEEVASRLATPKRQQAAAVQVAAEPATSPPEKGPAPQSSRSRSTGSADKAPAIGQIRPIPPIRPIPSGELERNDLISLLRDVLTEHGPCDRDTLIKQAATALGYQRVRGGLAEILSNAIRTAVRRQVLLNGGSTYSVNRAGIADFDMEFLKTQFLAAVSEQGRVWTDRDDAIRAFTRWFGFRRTGSVIDETARKLISRLLRSGNLEADGDFIRRK